MPGLPVTQVPMSSLSKYSKVVFKSAVVSVKPKDWSLWATKVSLKEGREIQGGCIARHQWEYFFQSLPVY